MAGSVVVAGAGAEGGGATGGGVCVSALGASFATSGELSTFARSFLPIG